MPKVSTWIAAAAVAAAALGFAAVMLVRRANWVTQDAQMLTITVDGQERDIYIQPTNASRDIEVSEDMKMVGQGFNQRMYLQNDDKNDPDDYFTVNLLGGSLEYDVDLSKVSGCNCITALYGVRMPAADENASGQKYCDAAGIEGSYCPGFDFMKANQFGLYSAAHSCSSTPYSESTCNASAQCAVDVYYGGIFDSAAEDPNNFGDDNTNIIDSSKPFSVRHDFNEDGSEKFVSHVTTLTQGSATLILDSTGCQDASALTAMTEDMKNMVLVISNYAEKMDDLTHKQCDASVPCTGDLSQSSIANIKITSKSGVKN